MASFVTIMAPCFTIMDSSVTIIAAGMLQIWPHVCYNYGENIHVSYGRTLVTTIAKLNVKIMVNVKNCNTVRLLIYENFFIS